MLRGLRRLTGFVFFLVIVLYLLASFVIMQGATSAERKALEQQPADLGLRFEAISFPSRRDSVRLEGWLLPGESGAPSIVFVHGLGSTRSGDHALELARLLQGRGYNALLFDLRAHGSSGGERVAAGLHEKSDVLGAIDYLRSRGLSRPVGLLGFSYGAATALLAAADEPAVQAVVADSPFARATDLIAQETARKTPVPEWLAPAFLPGAGALALLFHGIDLRDSAPDRAAGRLTYPVLVIHGEADERIPVEHGRRVYESAPAGSELWLVPDAGHVEAYELQPREYERRLLAYLESRLGR